MYNFVFFPYQKASVTLFLPPSLDRYKASSVALINVSASLAISGNAATPKLIVILSNSLLYGSSVFSTAFLNFSAAINASLMAVSGKMTVNSSPP